MSSSSHKSNLPYFPGSSILLSISDTEIIEAKIVESKTTTLSCVMIVEFPTSPDRYILKLYDRRFAEQLRRDEEAAAWNIQIENRYNEFLRSRNQVTLFHRWSAGFRGDHYYADDQRGQWDEAVLETYLQFLCRQTYNTEVHAYNLMRDLQGKSVPVFHNEVRLINTSAGSKTGPDVPDIYTDCPGIILQYIPGCPLTDIAGNVPTEQWQHTCEEAISIIHQIGDRGICNKDVKTRSFILFRDLNLVSPQIFMVDFGACVFKDQAANEREFREWQADQDEEGAIGCVMERHLKGHLKGGFKYQRSERAERLLYEFKREE